MRSTLTEHVYVPVQIKTIHCDSCKNSTSEGKDRGWGTLGYISRQRNLINIDICPNCMIKKFPEIIY